ncbi:MAG: phytochelatin synthase family protein [Endozoicomonas sp. (ex Botrylloides leachii)]|nr:phytochelatin synthase family protein [Endozoicomonas sp. (ex Botrylloides leachii)]
MKTIFIILIIFTSNIYASYIDWNSKKGKEMFRRSISNDFFELANHFIAQPNGIVCGPTTMSIVLNALFQKDNVINQRTEMNGIFKFSGDYNPTLKKYTPYNVINEKNSNIKSWEIIYGKKIKGKSDWGLQLRQLHKLFLSYDVSSKIYVVKNIKKDINEFKRNAIKVLENQNDFIVVNYRRSEVNQKGSGHISPIASYDKQTDSFLVMDVNPTKYPWAWIKAKDLIKSMGTFDTNENRGYLIITKK